MEKLYEAVKTDLAIYMTVGKRFIHSLPDCWKSRVVSASLSIIKHCIT